MRSAITSPSYPTGPSEPPDAPKAARISSSVDGREPILSVESSFDSDSRSSPRMSASTTRPSSVVTGIAFDVAARSMPRNAASASHVVTPGVSTSSGAASGSRKLRGTRDAAGDLGVGGVVATLAADERVLSRPRRREEVERELAAHDPALGLNLVRLDAAALEDAVIRGAVLLERDERALLVAIERIRVLHDELANPQEAAARARLVTILGLKVVPELRQLLVRLDLARVEGERLLVRERQNELPARAVRDVEDLGDLVAAGRLPELDRRQHRSEELLRTDRVHLLANDLLDLAVDSPTERQIRPQASADLAHETATHEQLVRGRLRVGGWLAQGRQEEL